METNLGSLTEVGEPGWLYEETKSLVKEFGVILTISGDSRWLNRFVLGKPNDSCASLAGIWIPDPGKNFMERILTECEDRSMIEEIFENNRIQARPEGLTQEANCAEKQPELTQQQRYVEKQKRLQFCLSDKSLINYLRQNNIILP